MLTKGAISPRQRTSHARGRTDCRAVLPPWGGARCVPDNHSAASSDGSISDHTPLLCCYVGALGRDGRVREQQEGARTVLQYLRTTFTSSAPVALGAAADHRFRTDLFLDAVSV